MKKQTNTVTTETFTWDEQSLLMVLAMAAGIPAESVTALIVKSANHSEGLGGSYSEGPSVTLTRTMKVT